MALAGRVCVVTGATRGIGKGIALQLGEAGATVYITGRTLQAKPGQSGSLEDTAKEIDDRGGRCIPVQCDHSKDADIESLFNKVKEEQSGRLDLLVNNAFSAVNSIVDAYKKKFWDLPTSIWDEVNDVGLRNHYLCTVYATRLMVEQGSGMILWISSFGAVKYVFNVAYGVGKVGCDRMAADCGFELRDKNVSCMSLWPGVVRTENFIKAADERADLLGQFDLKGEGLSQSMEFTGKVIAKLMQGTMVVSSIDKLQQQDDYRTHQCKSQSWGKDVHLTEKESDSERQKRNGKVVIVSDVADHYGIADIDGSRPLSLRGIGFMFLMGGYKKVAYCIPRWLKLPKWMLTMAGHRF